MADFARRSVPFGILPYDSPGDGEFLSNLSPSHVLQKARSQRKKRKSKTRKPNSSQIGLEILGTVPRQDDFSMSVPPEEWIFSPFSAGDHNCSLTESAVLCSVSLPNQLSLLNCPSSVPNCSSMMLSKSQNNQSSSIITLSCTADDGRSASDTGKVAESHECTDLRASEIGGFQLVNRADSAVAGSTEVHSCQSSDSSCSLGSVICKDRDGSCVQSPGALDSLIQAVAASGQKGCMLDRFVQGDLISPGDRESEDKRFPSADYSTPKLREQSLSMLENDFVMNGSDSVIPTLFPDQGETKGITQKWSFPKGDRDNSGQTVHLIPPTLPLFPGTQSKTPQVLDWEQLMAANADYPQPAYTSPLRYFIGEVLRGSTAQATVSVENDQRRQHVYNTMFHVPWRCELLIDVGFFVCLDSFLSLFTVMPIRILLLLWRCLASQSKLQMPRADELCDFACLLVLISGVTLLQQVDISYIYHTIRLQSTIKLYVVYNVLEIFDKLLQSFGSDVLQVLFNSAEGVAVCSKDLFFESMRFVLDQFIAVVSFIVHSLIIMFQSITITAAIRSYNNAVVALLISNNFAEIKSNVFKRLAKDNLHKLAYLDTVERFHIIAHLFFVLAQNILAADEPWMLNFAWNAGMVLICEILVDAIKHAFLAKFNEIKPVAYSEFLQALCEQTLSNQSHEAHKTLNFVPLAPACVVIRVLIPLYAAHLPHAPFWWRFLHILFLLLTTYFLLVILKIMVGLGLQRHARWYVTRCRRKEKHLHTD